MVFEELVRVLLRWHPCEWVDEAAFPRGSGVVFFVFMRVPRLLGSRRGGGAEAYKQLWLVAVVGRSPPGSLLLILGAIVRGKVDLSSLRGRLCAEVFYKGMCFPNV